MVVSFSLVGGSSIGWGSKGEIEIEVKERDRGVRWGMWEVRHDADYHYCTHDLPLLANPLLSAWTIDETNPSMRLSEGSHVCCTHMEQKRMEWVVVIAFSFRSDRDSSGWISS